MLLQLVIASPHFFIKGRKTRRSVKLNYKNTGCFLDYILCPEYFIILHHFSLILHKILVYFQWTIPTRAHTCTLCYLWGAKKLFRKDVQIKMRVIHVLDSHKRGSNTSVSQERMGNVISVICICALSEVLKLFLLKQQTNLLTISIDSSCHALTFWMEHLLLCFAFTNGRKPIVCIHAHTQCTEINTGLNTNALCLAFVGLGISREGYLPDWKTGTFRGDRWASLLLRV